MKLLDLVILVFLAFFLYRGAKKGLIREIFGLIAVLGALFCAVVFVDVGVAVIKDVGEVPASLSLFISFLLIFISVFVVVWIVGAVLSKLIRLTLLVWFDRLGGLLIGLFKGVLIASLILLGLNLLSWPRGICDVIDDSEFAPSVQMAAPRFFNAVKSLFPSAKSIYEEFKESIDLYRKPDSEMPKSDSEMLKEEIEKVKKVLDILEKAD